MSTPSNIEPECHAIIRTTGEPVVVGMRHVGCNGHPDMFSTRLGNFRAGELYRVSPKHYASVIEALDLLEHFNAFGDPSTQELHSGHVHNQKP